MLRILSFALLFCVVIFSALFLSCTEAKPFLGKPTILTREQMLLEPEMDADILAMSNQFQPDNYGGLGIFGR